MKPTLFLFTGILAISVMSCNDDKKETVTYVKQDSSISATSVTDVAHAALSEGKSVIVTTDKVPDSVELTFKKKYPKVLSPQWVEYTPVESDELPMDDTYYYVNFTDRGEDITSWYNNTGEWVKTSTVVAGDSRLPDAVNKTLNAMYPGYKIEEIKKENDKNREMYKIKMNKGEDKVKLKILPNGEIFKLK